MQISYKPRMFVRWNYAPLDQNDVAVHFDPIKKEYYVGPPDFSSDSLDELVSRWLIYFRFVDKIKNFNIDQILCMSPIIGEAF